MDISERKENGVVVLVCKGRLDGYGAGILEQAAKEALHDDDRSLVLDIQDVPYLSSAGIRVMLALQKRLRERGGKVALAGVGDFTRKVLDMAGFLSIFPHYASAGEAIRVLGRAEERSLLLADLRSPSVEKDGARLNAEPGSQKPASLNIWGDPGTILFSRVDASQIAVLPFSRSGYAIGMGAPGMNPEEVLPFLGEMVVLHGSLVWLPTDGNDTPDFFTPVKDTGELKVYAGYAISLEGPFREYIILESLSRDGMTIGEIYDLLVHWAREHYRDYRGILAAAWWAVLEGLQSHGIRQSPIPEHAPPRGVSIKDPDLVDSWFENRTVPKYRGDTLVGFGIVVDREEAGRSFDNKSLDSLVPIHPGDRKREKITSQTNGVVFRNVSYDPGAAFESQVKKILGEAEFVDMRHLSAETRIRKAKIGIAPVSSLERK